LLLFSVNPSNYSKNLNSKSAEQNLDGDEIFFLIPTEIVKNLKSANFNINHDRGTQEKVLNNP
jgi:hypothetical protein